MGASGGGAATCMPPIRGHGAVHVWGVLPLLAWRTSTKGSAAAATASGWTAARVPTSGALVQQWGAAVGVGRARAAAAAVPRLPTWDVHARRGVQVCAPTAATTTACAAWPSSVMGTATKAAAAAAAVLNGGARGGPAAIGAGGDPCSQRRGLEGGRSGGG